MVNIHATSRSWCVSRLFAVRFSPWSFDCVVPFGKSLCSARFRHVATLLDLRRCSPAIFARRSFVFRFQTRDAYHLYKMTFIYIKESPRGREKEVSEQYDIITKPHRQHPISAKPETWNANINPCYLSFAVEVDLIRRGASVELGVDARPIRRAK